jgi:hypothetical protein
MTNFMVLNDTRVFADWLLLNKFKRPIKTIQNHHTWSPGYKDFNGGNHLQLLKSMETHHISRGFECIAQNITTFPDGKIAVCRSFDKAPAGIKGANSESLCIEHIGNFDVNGDVMSDAHKNCILHLNSILCNYFKITPSEQSILYHHWFDLNTGKRTNGSGNTKTCPGTNFFGGNSVECAKTNFIKIVASM